jgi:glycyl-tRNA synthetase (class II)
MQWNAGFTESVYTFANTIHTHEGGAHEEGFRTALTSVVNKFGEEWGFIRKKEDRLTGEDIRTVLRLDPRLAPVKVAVLPLSRNAELSPKAKDLAAQLRKRYNVEFDDAGAIGRRYRRQDEIGTPYCVTVDFDTLEDQAVTVRDRDSMEQQRISLDKLDGWLAERLPIS